LSQKSSVGKICPKSGKNVDFFDEKNTQDEESKSSDDRKSHGLTVLVIDNSQNTTDSFFDSQLFGLKIEPKKNQKIKKIKKIKKIFQTLHKETVIIAILTILSLMICLILLFMVIYSI